MGKLSVLTEIMKKHKKLLIVGAVVVTTAGVGVSVVSNMNEKKEQMLAMMNQTQTSKVERRTLVSSVSATGTVTSVDSKNVSANLSGIEVKSVSVEVGDVVEAGQILCVLDSDKIQEELTDARTALNIANEKTKMDLVAAERNLGNAQQDYVTDIERGNEDLNSVYIDYADAVQEENEAKIEWIDAQNKTIEKKAEYDNKKEKLDKLEKKLDSMEEASTYSQRFNIKKAELSVYAANNGVRLNNAIESQLVIGDAFIDITDISVGTDSGHDFYIGGLVTSGGNNSSTVSNKAPAVEDDVTSDSTTGDDDTTNDDGSTDGEGNGSTADDESTGDEGDGSTADDESTDGEGNGSTADDESTDDEGDESTTGVDESIDEEQEDVDDNSEENSEVKDDSSNEGTEDHQNVSSTGEEQAGETDDENNETARIISEPVVGDNNQKSQTFAGASDDEIKDKIWEYLYALKGLNDSYQTRMDLEEEFAELKQDVATLEAEHKTAEQEESAAEKAYDQAVAASESQLNAFEKQQRTMADTAKSGQNGILSKSESLYSSQLNSLTSGDSEAEKIKDYQEQIQDCTIKAPMSGVVTAVNVEAGDMYNGSTVVTIEDVSAFEVTTEIDEYDIGKIEKGQKVIIKTNATGDEELEGTVSHISPRASAGSSEVTYTVTISIDTLHEMLRMDMTAKLSIILESKENVLTVPYEAVQEDESGKSYVEVVIEAEESQSGELSQMPETVESGEMPQMSEEMEKAEIPQMSNGMKTEGRTKGTKALGGSSDNTDNTTKRVYVEKGMESDYYIEIISNEISEGMEIVVPSSNEKGGMDIQGMMMRQGPMGGF